VWAKRRGAVEPACDVSTWSETGRGIFPRAVLTERARKPLADMVNIDGDSIASSAVFFGVGWRAANQAVRALDNRHPRSPPRADSVCSGLMWDTVFRELM